MNFSLLDHLHFAVLAPQNQEPWFFIVWFEKISIKVLKLQSLIFKNILDMQPNNNLQQLQRGQSMEDPRR